MPHTASLAPGQQADQPGGGAGLSMPFEGFEAPESNFWRLPNNWFDLAARFTSWAEHKVVEYILRHTWGYHEYGVVKLITMDEFMHGRKRRDGSRMDAGCGMAENSIKKGINDAVAHGFVIVQIDDSDKGRIKKYYAPRMRRPIEDEGEHTAITPGGQPLRGQGQSLTPQYQNVIPQSASLTLQVQLPTPADHDLRVGVPTTDPRTEQTPLVTHSKKHTLRNNNPVVAVPTAETDKNTTAPAVPSPMRADLVARLVAEGIGAAKARSLAQTYPAERIEQQLAWIDGRSYQNRAATLVTAIERDFDAPVPRRSQSGEPSAFDRAKFYRGSYAMCPHCGCRPCAPECAGAVEAASVALG